MADALPLVIYTDLEQQVEAMERDGYVYFPSVLAEDEIVELRDQSEQLEAVPEALDTDLTVEKDGHLNRCINAAFNRDPLFLKYLDKPGPIELAEAIHGPDCHIVSVHTWAVGTGRPDQQLHSDWLPAVMPAELRGDSRLEIPIYITTAHFYLDDMTEELGPTNIVPGSHLAGRRPHGPVEGDSNHGESEWNGVGEQNFLGNAGDCILFRSEIWHRGTANVSDHTRHTFMVHYSHRMITQKFPPYLHFKFNPEVIAQATQRQRRLLGEHPGGSYD